MAFAQVEPPVKWSGNIYKIIHSFNKEFEKFSKQVCRSGEEKKYWSLLRDYRGQGYYLPKLGADIDRLAIKKNISHYQKKLVYILDLQRKLRKAKKFPKFSLIFDELEKIVTQLLNLKKIYNTEIRQERKAKILLESQRHLIKFKKQFDVFVNHLFFMKSYNFPNNYLQYRATFEHYKYNVENIKKANETFFFRRIVEDGAMDPNRSNSDKYTRTTLDTLYLNIQKEQDFISEVVRYDLAWMKKSLARILKRGRDVQMKRLVEWHKRTQKSYDFYREIIKTTNEKKAKYLVKKENDSSVQLKEFVYKKQAEVYGYWAKKSELFKALYSLETILINEVGVLDGKFALERQSVAQVVINRYFDDFYNQLEEDQMLFGFVSKDIDKEDEHWLNVLFKIGEFSFTYHYIPAVSKIFCPDMSRRGKNIRSENLKVILKSLKNYDGTEFSAFRYFSRISMLGKIDMSTVWTGYDRLPEMVGYESSHQRRLMRFYLADRYQYFYTFVDAKNIEYSVVEIDDKTYSMRWIKGKPVFFDYRNPHLFAYFSKKK
jgi:hypothetical protein